MESSPHGLLGWESIFLEGNRMAERRATGFDKRLSKQLTKKFSDSALMMLIIRLQKVLCQQTTVERSGTPL